jgi:malonyl-CoA/methylmalonyl-CoA synthetase
MPPSYVHDQPISILRAFLHTCEQTPDKTFILFEGQHYSYAQVYRAAAAWAEKLQQAGIRRGDRVALYLGNSPTFFAAYLGAHLTCGIVVLVNIQYQQVELRHILTDSGARYCITDQERLPALEQVRPAAPALAHVLVIPDEWLSDEPDRRVEEVVRLFDLPYTADIALLGYTSGTTGRAKGAMLTHGNLEANSAAVTSAWHWTSADVLLLTLPLFHIHGLGVGMHGACMTGSTVDLRRRFDAAEVFDTLMQGSMTMFFGVPTMYTRLIAEAQQRGQKPPPIRLYVSGSAPLSVHAFETFERLFGAQILERYGMTETVMNLTNPYDGERRPGTVGQPFPGQEARIVDVETRQPVPPETPGEIQVRGPHVFKGYWQRPDATAEVFDAEGWFSTGDLGWVSADGYYTISGRARELIISGGYNVYPREVEEVLLEHTAVSEAAVIGLPHPDLGEQVIAVIVGQQQFEVGQQPVDALTVPDEQQRRLAETLVEQCRTQLAAYKKPRQVFFVDALPRNALGKVQKHVLRDQLQPADNELT